MKDWYYITILFVLLMPPSCVDNGIGHDHYFPKDSLISGIWKLVDKKANEK